MTANPALGVLLHATGGLAAASFYLPYKGVRQWPWENYWLLGGVFSWILAPWALALLIVPDVRGVLATALAEHPQAVGWAFGFGVLWGIGGLTFGLSMRYLGIALGYAIALGLCAVFGTLMPPLFKGELGAIGGAASGQVTLLGVAACIAGIVISGQAGMAKERELSDEKKKAAVQEFSFWKGLLVAVFAGVMSASMSYGFAAGKPIAALAVQRGAPELWQNLPVWIIILAGGFATNFVWCLVLNLKNRTLGDYFRSHVGTQRVPWVRNVALCALAGVTWYFQFFFYGMGTTQMGPYDFSSWTLHMASIIIFSTLWGVTLREWAGTSRRTHRLIAAGLAVLVLSTVVVGYGNYLGAQAKAATLPARAAAAGGNLAR